MEIHRRVFKDGGGREAKAYYFQVAGAGAPPALPEEMQHATPKACSPVCATLMGPWVPGAEPLWVQEPDPLEIAEWATESA